MREEILPLKCCQSLKMQIFFDEGFKSVHEFNKGTVGQRAGKLSWMEVFEKVCRLSQESCGQSGFDTLTI